MNNKIYVYKWDLDTSDVKRALVQALKTYDEGFHADVLLDENSRLRTHIDSCDGWCLCAVDARDAARDAIANRLKTMREELASLNAAIKLCEASMDLTISKGLSSE